MVTSKQCKNLLLSLMTLHSWLVIDDSYFLSSVILAAFLKHSDFVCVIKKKLAVHQTC